MSKDVLLWPLETKPTRPAEPKGVLGNFLDQGALDLNGEGRTEEGWAFMPTVTFYNR